MTALNELTTPVEFKAAYPVMAELRDHLTEKEYLRRITRMQDEGYRLLALRDDTGDIVALAGFKIFVTLYAGNTLHVYDLVTASAARSRGYGQTMMEHIYTLGRENNCDAVTLDSGLQRLDAHRFYETKADIHKMGYAFRKDL